MVVSKARYMVRRTVILGVFALAVAGFASGQMADATSSKVTSAHYLVQSGDTLWSIATAQAPDSDPRDFVAEIVELNQLQTAVLVPGQDLLLPNN